MGKALQLLQSALVRYGPHAMDAFISYMKIATNQQVTTIDQAMKFGAQNQRNFAVVSQGAVTCGISPSEFFPAVGEKESTKEMTNLYTSLSALAAKIVKHADDSRKDLIPMAQDDLVDDVTRIHLGKTLVRAFGSLSAAREVQLALDTLTEQDFVWLEATDRARRS